MSEPAEVSNSLTSSEDISITFTRCKQLLLFIRWTYWTWVAKFVLYSNITRSTQWTWVIQILQSRSGSTCSPDIIDIEQDEIIEVFLWPLTRCSWGIIYPNPRYVLSISASNIIVIKSNRVEATQASNDFGVFDEIKRNQSWTLINAICFQITKRSEVIEEQAGIQFKKEETIDMLLASSKRIRIKEFFQASRIWCEGSWEGKTDV